MRNGLRRRTYKEPSIVRTKIMTLSVVLGLCVPGVAVAATPTQDTYGGQLGQVSGASNGGGPSSGTPANATGPSSSSAGPSSDGPNSGTRVAASTNASAPSKSSGTSSTGTLPFTGLDVGVMAAIGLGLAGLGFATRRATRTADSVRS